MSTGFGYLKDMEEPSAAAKRGESDCVILRHSPMEAALAQRPWALAAKAQTVTMQAVITSIPATEVRGGRLHFSQPWARRSCSGMVQASGITDDAENRTAKARIRPGHEPEKLVAARRCTAELFWLR